MKRAIIQIYLCLIFLVLFTSCGFHDGLSYNVNQSQTSIVLSQKNYKVIEKVTGTASARYIFGIGGLRAKALVDKARNNMVMKNKLVGGARAFIYPTVEIHSTWCVPFFGKKTVTYSGYLIEFTE